MERWAGLLALATVVVAGCAGAGGGDSFGQTDVPASDPAGDPSVADGTTDVAAPDPGQAPDLPAGDAGADGLDDAGPDPGEPQALCGNGEVEPPAEACERLETRACTEFGFNFTGGNAWCRDDCTGWSMAACATDGTAVCGNGRKESAAGVLEFCDTGAAPCPLLAEDPLCFDGVKDCRDLGTGWSGGTSACSADCRTADVSACTTAVPPWGTLAAAFETPYVLDDGMLSVAGYVSAHRDALVGSPAFTGTYDDGVSIPAGAPAATISYALRNARRTASGWYDQIYVVQETATGAGDALAYTGAQLELRFRDGPLAAGDVHPVNANVMGATRLYLFHYTNPDGSGTPDGSLRCLAAVGIGGRIRITKAEDLYAEDGSPATAGGGRLAFEAEGITLYWLGETPYGTDLSEDFTKPGGVNGVGMCQRAP